MFSIFFGKTSSGLGAVNQKLENGVTFRSMVKRDIEPVLAIIEAHDEDDAEEALETFQGSLAGYFVLDYNGTAIGCTGFDRDEETFASAWLSWTYVDDLYARQGYGTQMMQALRQQLERQEISRIFIDTSDYKEDGVDIYEAARKFYNYLGARQELMIQDYFQPGEAKYVFSLPVTDFFTYDYSYEAPQAIGFVDLANAAESDTGYVIGWEEVKKTDDHLALQDSNLSALTNLVDQARAKGGHMISISIPDPLSAQNMSILTKAGFQKAGTLRDYYAPGLHDVYWIQYLA